MIAIVCTLLHYMYQLCYINRGIKVGGHRPAFSASTLRNPFIMGKILNLVYLVRYGERSLLSLQFANLGIVGI